MPLLTGNALGQRRSIDRKPLSIAGGGPGRCRSTRSAHRSEPGWRHGIAESHHACRRCGRRNNAWRDITLRSAVHEFWGRSLRKPGVTGNLMHHLFGAGHFAARAKATARTVFLPRTSLSAVDRFRRRLVACPPNVVVGRRSGQRRVLVRMCGLWWLHSGVVAKAPRRFCRESIAAGGFA